MRRQSSLSEASCPNGSRRSFEIPEWVQPEPRDPDAERRFGSVRAFGGRILRVVSVETDTNIRIITATFDRGARRP
jgi:hypothetical protein